MITFALAFAACGDDDETATTTTADAAGGETVEVTAVDYEFEGLPDSVTAGTRLTLVNESEAEIHELVAIRLPDDEQRSVDELVALPEAELQALFRGGEPAMVLVARPASDETIPAVGDGTLADAGRYALLCAIPTGADPDEYLAAAGAAEGGPPDVPGGPPHFVNGMYAELTVE